MAKADLEFDHEEYLAALEQAQLAMRTADLADAVAHAVQSFEHVDGMMQFEKRYNDVESVAVDTVSLVIENAPLVFDNDALDKVESLLASKKRIERNAQGHLREKLAAAREAIREVGLVWDHIDRLQESTDAREWFAIPCKTARWRFIVSAWSAMGIIRPVERDGADAFEWVTRMDAATRAKCSSCGTLAKGPRVRLLEPAVCPACRQKVSFVLVGDEEPAVS